MKKVKTKVKDLALEISVEIKDILSKCKELSIIARSSSSSISDEDAEKIKNSFSKSQIVKEKSDRDIVKRTGSKVTIRRKKAAKVKEVVEERNSVESDNLKIKELSLKKNSRFPKYPLNSSIFIEIPTRPSNVMEFCQMLY